MTARRPAGTHAAAFANMRESPATPVAAPRLLDLAQLRPTLEQIITRAVLGARTEGIARRRIGDALSVTHGAVIKHYGPVVQGGGQR